MKKRGKVQDQQRSLEPLGRFATASMSFCMASCCKRTCTSWAV